MATEKRQIPSVNVNEKWTLWTYLIKEKTNAISQSYKDVKIMNGLRFKGQVFKPQNRQRWAARKAVRVIVLLYQEVKGSICDSRLGRRNSRVLAREREPLCVLLLSIWTSVIDPGQVKKGEMSSMSVNVQCIASIHVHIHTTHTHTHTHRMPSCPSPILCPRQYVTMFSHLELSWLSVR